MAKSGPSQADQLLMLAQARYRLLSGPDGRPYATEMDGSAIALPLRGPNGVRLQLAAAYAGKYRRPPSSGALSDVVAVLEGQARTASPEPVGLRVAAGPDGGGLVLDLGDPAGRAVVIGPGGWQLVDRSPVLFRRTSLTAPLPVPQRGGGGLEALRRLLNVDDDGWGLVLSWLVSALIPAIPHPILAMYGEAGTAKSNALKMVLGLIEPGPSKCQAAPKDVEQWAVTASASWCVGLDNVSHIPHWFSDALCRAVTGDAIIKRALYTDDDVSVLTFRRAVALSSVESGALAGDLAERMLPVELYVISEERRRSETELAATYAELHAAALADLLDLATGTLAALPDTHLERMPRMADYAQVLAATDTVRGTAASKSYASTRHDLAEQVVEADLFAMAIDRLVTHHGRWSGTSTQLRDAIRPEQPPRHWPMTPEGTRQRLTRAMPGLRKLGVEVVFTRADDRKRSRLIELFLSSSQDERGEQLSALSALSAEPAKPQVTAPNGLRTVPKTNRPQPAPHLTCATPRRRTGRPVRTVHDLRIRIRPSAAPATSAAPAAASAAPSTPTSSAGSAPPARPPTPRPRAV